MNTLGISILDNISKVHRIGLSYQKKLNKIGIKKVKDLLLYFPRDYQDLRDLRKISDIKIGEINTVRGFILSSKATPARFSKIDILKAIFQDETGAIEVVWFNQNFLKDVLKPGTEVILSGKVDFNRGKLNFKSPSYEFAKENLVHTGRIVPIYRETEGVSSKWLRSIIAPLLALSDEIDDHFDNKICDRNNILSLSKAIKKIHFPETDKDLEEAKKRLAFDELFFLQLKAILSRIEWQKHNIKEEDLIKIPFDEKKVKEFLGILPFTLTGDQKIAVYQILKDLEKGYPMLRLLEGDVGSGKTVVSAIALYIVAKSGYQGVLMAPTEVLAKQHYKTVTSLLMKFGINTQLLVGSTTDKEKKEIKISIKNGTIDVVIGTHAIIQPTVEFKSLGLVVVDEQHRFGVEQRSALKKKGNPHLLNMTATPIPRSLALTICGDQDLSIIKEKPKGRKKVITRVISPKYRSTAELFIEDQINKGRQIFVICPLVEDSDVLEVKSVKAEFERLRKEVFKNYNIGLLHGRLKPKEKDVVMQKFKDKEIDILVSTSVVEVGVDVPNATIMVIEGAERFGLAQLHQFRGRVGRSDHQSYCFLFTDSLTEKNRKRMKAMVEHSSGFKLSEIDLKLRGPGEVFGTRQSGIPDLKMASLNDKEMITNTRIEVEKMFDQDPEFKKHPLIKKKLGEYLEKIYSG